MLDAGNLNPPGRDADRILAAMKAARVERIDYLVVTHYHGDHVGGVAALAGKVPIRRVLDPGASIPEQHAGRDAAYRSYLPVRQNAHVTVAKPGSRIPVAGLKVSARSDGSFTVTNGRSGFSKHYPTQPAAVTSNR